MARRAVESALPQRPRLYVVPAGERTTLGRLFGVTNKGLILGLLVSALGLTVVGLVMVLSASSVSSLLIHGSSFSLFERQFVYALVGLVALVGAARTPYVFWQRVSVPLLVGTVILLALVLHPAAGRVAGGSARWIEFGPVTIQPSEIAKLAMVAFAASLLAKRWKRIQEPAQVIVPIGVALTVMFILVMLQPDLGTTLVIGGAIFILLFAAGIHLRYLVVGAVLGGTFGLAMIMTAAYRRERFFSFLDPWGDPQNTGYQLIQSLIGLASGGLSGVGLGASRQKWMYLPNAHTDFIFSIIGEELGLVGEMVILMLFGALMYVGIRVAARAPDVFGWLLASGIVGWFGFQAIINLGAVTGLLPITGVPLPFVSFGGSSLVVCLASVGILISIARAGPRGRGRLPAHRPATKNSASRRSSIRRSAARPSR